MKTVKGKEELLKSLFNVGFKKKKNLGRVKKNNLKPYRVKYYFNRLAFLFSL